MKRNKPLFIITLILALVGITFGATLSYSPLVPQTGDSDLIIRNKAAVSMARLAAGNSYSNITTATTTAVKASAGVLERIIVNSAGTGTTLVVYDNTAGSGTKIATLTTTAQASLTFDVAFSTGLTVVSDAGSGAANITVVYR